MVKQKRNHYESNIPYSIYHDMGKIIKEKILRCIF